MAALSQKIGELAADGIIDPAELRRLALESWRFGEREGNLLAATCENWRRGLFRSNWIR